MSDWSNLEEIMQDLSVAQGYMVPGDLETFAAVGPPAYNIEKEEEQPQLTPEVEGSGDFPVPNYRLIQNMLERVKENEQDDEVAHSTDHDPQDTQQPQKLKNKTKRNIAMSSIMMANEAEHSARRPIPTDAVPMMFKKKSSKHTKDRHRSENVSSLQTFSPSSEKSKQYTPSANALAFYSEYLGKSQLRDQFEDDIWARAEKQMKELEARRKRKLLQSRKERAAYELALPEHRHLLPGDCVVCAVHAQHGYYL